MHKGVLCTAWIGSPIGTPSWEEGDLDLVAVIIFMNFSAVFLCSDYYLHPVVSSCNSWVNFFSTIFFCLGSFEEDKTQAPVKFFQVSGGVDGDITSSDNFDWPR